MKPNFNNIDLTNTPSTRLSLEEWEKQHQIQSNWEIDFVN
jgi:hypothetical protein